MKVVENNPQSARNCTILKKNFLGGHAPKPPYQRLAALRHVYPKSQKFLKLGPPPEKSCIRPCVNTVKYLEFVFCENKKDAGDMLRQLRSNLTTQFAHLITVQLMLNYC